MGTTRKQTVAKKANAGGTISKTRKLNKAALNLVENNATEMAESLYKSTLEGHVLSAKLLVQLTEGEVAPEEALAMRPLRTVAMNLAAEKQWTGDKPEPDAEMEEDNPVMVAA